MFKPVDPKVDFPKLEEEFLKRWYEKGIVKKYLERNKNSKNQFSFLDGPITANNPMGVHHAWGRTYKDFWQRFWNMKGYRERFQNGFDEQGLWVEVEVEKELGLHSKKDIENLVLGNKFKSLEKFINLCKERVKKYSGIQTEQSRRLGYFMDWENSYHTSSDKNNYTIWNFIKAVNEKGWLYKGHDTVPWCPRCGTAISQHEILTEEYKELTHETVYFKLPIKGRHNDFLLVWTTTPWTIPSNVAVAVNPKETYVSIHGNTGERLWVMEKRVSIIDDKKGEPLERKTGKELLGWTYEGPFDNLPLVKNTLGNYIHRIIDGGEIVTETEGTGLLHVAPGAGEEDFKLSKENKLPVIATIEEDASYMGGLGEFSGQNAKKHPDLIIDYLKNKDGGKFFVKTEKYKHRYPTCWRCKTELVWRIVDEWYIAMDKQDNSGKTYREQMIEVAEKITWMPDWGLARELDWLNNMHDWLISKKRYWGLALPIWECQKCKAFKVIGSREELEKNAVEGWSKFDGNSPHRPWIDQVKVKCDNCGEIVERIPDVGNPWLDAGIVPFSTMPEDWFPADFITESFPGQFKNWFYSLIAMSTALKKTNSFKRVLGFGSVRDEKGEEMHKSKGNAVEFNEAADKIGVDVMRWLYLRTNPEHNVNFGYSVLDQLKRLFLIKLWNVYSFFVTYANLYGFTSQSTAKNKFDPKNILDKWILSRMTGNVKDITKAIENYMAYEAMGLVEIFINDLSNWYVRRIRDRVSKNEHEKDRREALQTLWVVLTEYSKVLAPIIPFMADEIFTSLTASESVHLEDWPELNEDWKLEKLEESMGNGIKVASVVNMHRKIAGVPVRIPVRKLAYKGPKELDKEVKEIVLQEVNVYELEYLGKWDTKIDDYSVEGDVKSEANQDLEAGRAREIIRKIQAERKNLGTRLDEMVDVELTDWPKDFEKEIKRKALIDKLISAHEFRVIKKNNA